MSTSALTAARAAFRDELLRAGLLIPTGSEGLYGRGARFEQLVQQVQSAIGDALDRLLPGDVLRPSFPPLYPRDAYERTDYIASFPNLTGAIHSFTGGDREHRALLAEREHSQHWDAHLTPTELMLVPAVCHPLYGTLPVELPAGRGHRRADRVVLPHEPSPRPGAVADLPDARDRPRRHRRADRRTSAAVARRGARGAHRSRPRGGAGGCQ